MRQFVKKIKIEENSSVVGLSDLGRKVAAEGIVLLKNEDELLPLVDKKIAIFGRIQTDYYKSGTGSGGLVNVSHVTSILEGLMENPLVSINQSVLNAYRSWILDNPYNAGDGSWASEPWSQIEMPLEEDFVKRASQESDVAVIIIGRTAGEDRDNFLGEGSIFLSKSERAMLDVVTKNFAKVVVVLNVGNIIDMQFMDEYPISAVLYAWHGGMEGGRAVSEVLTGLVNPSGKLVDTVADINDYPSTKNFGGKDKNVYQEDIYVGYRYFETFAKDKVRYPFGFGLSYTTFSLSSSVKVKKEKVIIETIVKNTGKVSGKEAVQVYFEAPQGVLGKPSRQLAAFIKTNIIQPGDEEKLCFKIDTNKFASYDDGGYTGVKSAYVLEPGDYNIYVGNSVRHNELVYTYNIEKLRVVEQLSEAAAPKMNFKRMKPSFVDGKFEVIYEDVPTKTISLSDRIETNVPENYENNLIKKHLLIDVYNKEITMEEFVAQLSVEEMACLFRSEGMSSPKVTPGTAGAFGGVTDQLLSYGIPIVCCSDGPSGIRMDSGQQASSLPNGTNLACTMNYDLIKELYYVEGKEMRSYNIDCLLGPGMNIHRNPLNGRNFEYFSEDPLITGIMGQAITVGLQRAGVAGTLKHMACNNQEYRRFDADSVLSERALREIYLKGFEIAVKAGKSRAIMTSYNPINGIWAAGNYDVNTTICHNEWGFRGLIMTDWWAKMNDEGEVPSKSNTKAMIKSQNDIYMVMPCSLDNPNNDNTVSSINEGTLSIGEAQRSARNICQFVMDSPAFKRQNNVQISESQYEVDAWYEADKLELDYPVIDSIAIDGVILESFSPFINTYLIDGDESKDITIEAKTKDKLEVIKNKTNCNTTVLKVSNNQEENIYYVMVIDVKKRQKENSALDTSSFTPTFINQITAGNWDTVAIDMQQPSYKTSKITITSEGLKDCAKGEIVSYAINVHRDGKYIVKITVCSNESNLAQMPISILVDETTKSTLTMSGTDGKTITIESHILIDKGMHYLSLRFGRTGIILKDVTLVTHS